MREKESYNVLGRRNRILNNLERGAYMSWRHKFSIFLCVLIIPSFGNAANPLYKTVNIGEHCSISIPFLWKKKQVKLDLPAHIKPNVVAYESFQLIGKEVIVSATYVKAKKTASIDGGISETVRQLSSLANTTDFSYSCAPFDVIGGRAKVCSINYKSGEVYVCGKAVFVVPNSDLSTAYILSGFYSKSYQWGEDVLDKIYLSMKLK